MKTQFKLALVTGVLALSASPALAAGPPSAVPPDNPSAGHIPANPGVGQVPENPGTDHKPATPGPGASLPAKAKAYGQYCQAESKEHVEGTPGTPFSQCVTAMAKLANGRTDNPREACKNESKEPVEGMRGTPFSQCVKAGAQLQGDLAQPSS